MVSFQEHWLTYLLRYVEINGHYYYGNRSFICSDYPNPIDFV